MSVFIWNKSTNPDEEIWQISTSLTRKWKAPDGSFQVYDFSYPGYENKNCIYGEEFYGSEGWSANDNYSYRVRCANNFWVILSEGTITYNRSPTDTD